eukprot:g18008.t1
MSSTGEASGGAFRRFATGGRTPCTRCSFVIPEGETMEALPPSDGQTWWRGHRCFPACKDPPRSPASTLANTRVFRQQFDGTKCTQCGMRIAAGQMMQAEKTRGRWRNIRHVRCRLPLPTSSRGTAAATPTRLDMGGAKRPYSSLDGGGTGSGSGSGSGSRVPRNLSQPAKRPRATTGAGSAAAPSPTPATRPRSQATTAVAARAAAAHARAAGASPSPRGGDDDDGVEVVRQVSVDERIAENQRRQGVIDLGGDDEANGVIDITSDDDEFVALTPPSLPKPSASASAAGAAARAIAKGGGGGGGGGKKGGGISRNLAATEGWSERPPWASKLLKLAEEFSPKDFLDKGFLAKNSKSKRTVVVFESSSAPLKPALKAPPANGGGGRAKFSSLSEKFHALESSQELAKDHGVAR